MKWTNISTNSSCYRNITIKLITILWFSELSISSVSGFASNNSGYIYGYHTIPNDSNLFITNTSKKNDKFTVKTDLKPLYTTPSIIEDVKCGEILLGIPTNENDDGSISVDIGIPQKLVVPKSSMVYMDESEKRQFYYLLNRYNSPNIKTSRCLSFDELIRETIEVSKNIPGRKRKTYLNPKISYPNDFLKTKIESYEHFGTSLGICGKITSKLTNDHKHANLSNISDSDKIEFVVTNVNLYSNVIEGEFFSEGVIESKRRIYLSMVTESANPLSHFTKFKAIIHDKYGTILKVKLIDSKFTHLSGLNAYTLSKADDKIGDIIDVYLAGADPVLEHIYLFRSQSDSLLRSERLNNIFNGLIKHYIDSGSWFKTQIETVENDYFTLRILGHDDKKYTGCLTKDKLPYSFPEHVLNEVFRRMNRTSEYFNKDDMRIGVSKLNYISNYDNSIYTRVSEVAVQGIRDYSDSFSKKEQKNIFLTCKNTYIPDNFIEKIYYKIITQKVANLDMKTGVSYPCLLLGNADECIYFAINYKFKENFTLEDDYIVGIMEVGQYSKYLPYNEIVHVKVSKIETFNIDRRYIVDTSTDNSLIFKENPLLVWLLHKNEGITHGDNLELKQISLIFMDQLYSLDPKCPQLNEFLVFQPIIANFRVDKSLGGRKPPDKQNPLYSDKRLVPQDITTSVLGKLKRVDEQNNNPKYGLETHYFSEKSQGSISFASFYIHNEGLRNEYIRRNLTKKHYNLYTRIVESSNFNSETIIREFLTDDTGQPFWDFLEKLKNPILRRKIRIKEALYFEINVKHLLSICEDFFLDDIYDYYDKEELIFCSIIPKPNGSAFYKMQELEEYLYFLNFDLVMDKKVKESLVRTIMLISRPRNSLIGLLRSRHRSIPNDVFFYSKKTIHYSSFETMSRPFEGKHSDLPYSTNEEDEYRVIPMLPYSTIIKEPNAFGHQLEGYGLKSMRKMYNTIIRSYKPIKTKYADTVGLMGELADDIQDIRESDLDDILNYEAFADLHDEMNEDVTSDNKKNLRITSKDWKLLNEYPITASKEDLKDYVRALKNFSPAHGIKLPTL